MVRTSNTKHDFMQCLLKYRVIQWDAHCRMVKFTILEALPLTRGSKGQFESPLTELPLNSTPFPYLLHDSNIIKFANLISEKYNPSTVSYLIKISEMIWNPRTLDSGPNIGRSRRQISGSPERAQERPKWCLQFRNRRNLQPFFCFFVNLLPFLTKNK